MRSAAAALLGVLFVAGCFGDLGGGSVVPKDFLTADQYTKWVIEVDYGSGLQPQQSLLSFIKSRLAPLVHKDSVEFRLGESFPSDSSSQTSWTDADLLSFAKQHKGVATSGTTVSLHLMFLAGHSAHDNGNARVLGVTYGHDLIAIFSQSVEASCDGSLPLPGLCSTDSFYRAVLMHEFGHAIGLVDNGVAMVRDHEAKSCGNQEDSHHSSNQDSVMYCQVESSAIVQLTTPPTDFDSDDKADLRAAGGR